jgi:hypothetical protein
VKYKTDAEPFFSMIPQSDPDETGNLIDNIKKVVVYFIRIELSSFSP